MKSLAQQLNAIAKKSIEKAENVVRETYFEVGARIIVPSPFDKGLFISNWLAGYDFSTQTFNSNNRDSLGKLKESLDIFDLNDKFFFTNSLPYAQKLEHGSSQQAPMGMVKVAANQFGTIAEKIIIKHSTV